MGSFTNLDVNMRSRAKSVTKSLAIAMKPIRKVEQYKEMNAKVERRLVQSYCNIHREAEVQKFLNRFPGLKEK